MSNWVSMIIRATVCFVIPVVVLVASAALIENFGSGLVVDAAHYIVTFMLTWPLDLLALAGFISPGDEGFYGRWMSVSLVISLFLIGTLLLAATSVLCARRGASTSSKPDRARASA
jgi:hypothetical protein